MPNEVENKSKNLEPVPAPPVEPPVEGPKMLVTHLKSVERQVGEHVITALQIPNAVAAISMVFPAPQGGQNVVSIPLPAETWESVRQLLHQVEAEAPRGMPCVGFHCFTGYADAGAETEADDHDEESQQ